jgi:hypothetical protein
MNIESFNQLEKTSKFAKSICNVQKGCSSWLLHQKFQKIYCLRLSTNFNNSQDTHLGVKMPSHKVKLTARNKKCITKDITTCYIFNHQQILWRRVQVCVRIWKIVLVCFFIWILRIVNLRKKEMGPQSYLVTEAVTVVDLNK